MRPARRELIDRLVGDPLVAWLAALAACGGLLFFLTEADLFFGRRGWLPVPPLVLMVGFLAVGGAILLFGDRSLSDGATRVVKTWIDSLPPLLPLVLLGGLALIQLVGADTGGRTPLSEALLLPLDAATFAGFALLALFSGVRERLRPVFLTAFWILATTLLIDAVMPGTFSKQVSRAAGLSINANSGAYHLCLLAAASLRFDRFRLGQAVLLATTGIAVFLTLSRSGLLIYLLLVVVAVGLHLLATPVERLRNLRAAARGLLLVALGLVGVWGVRVAVDRAPMFDRDFAQRRLGMLVGSEDFFFEQGERRLFLERAMDLVREAPFWGHGTGYGAAQDFGAHNQILALWIDHGILAPLLFILFLAGAGFHFAVRGSGAGLCVVAVIAGWSLFDHHLISDRSALAVLALLTAAVTIPRSREERAEPPPPRLAEEAA